MHTSYYRRHQTKFKVVLLESLGTAIHDLRYKMIVTEIVIAFYYFIKKPQNARLLMSCALHLFPPWLPGSSTMSLFSSLALF